MHLELTLISVRCCKYKARFSPATPPHQSSASFSQGSQLWEDVWTVGTGHHSNVSLGGRQPLRALEAPGSCTPLLRSGQRRLRSPFLPLPFPFDENVLILETEVIHVYLRLKHFRRLC